MPLFRKDGRCRNSGCGFFRVMQPILFYYHEIDSITIAVRLLRREGRWNGRKIIAL